MTALDPFKKAHDRANAAVLRHLANASGCWQGGEVFGVIWDTEGDDAFSESVTAVRQTISLCIANANGIDEGSVDLTINGHACRVTGPVVPDASGWATFSIVFSESSHVGP